MLILISLLPGQSLIPSSLHWGSVRARSLRRARRLTVTEEGRRW